MDWGGVHPQRGPRVRYSSCLIRLGCMHPGGGGLAYDVQRGHQEAAWVGKILPGKLRLIESGADLKLSDGLRIWLWVKNRYQNGTLVNGTKD